jgi:predicted nuclease with TOPRIM domain
MEQREFQLPQEVKEKIDYLNRQMSALVEGLVREYEEKVSSLQERVEELEQENVELKYKLKQLGDELKNLSEKIATEFLRRAESALEGVEKFNRE